MKAAAAWFTRPNSRSLSTIGIIDRGRLLANDSTDHVAIWDPAEGTRLDLPISGVVRTEVFATPFAIKPDNSIVAAGRDDGMVDCWSLTSRAKVSTWQAHRDSVFAVGFSADGRSLVTGTKSGEVKLWDLAAHAELSRLDLAGTNTRSLAFSPNGRLLAASAQTGLVVWDISTRKELIRSDCGGCEAPKVAFSPDGKLLAVTALELNEVHLWDPNAKTRIAVLKGLIGGAYNVAFSADGLTLAASGYRVKLWNVPTLREVGSIGEEDMVSSLAFSPDGRELALSYGKLNKHVSLWRAASLAEIDRIDNKK